MSRLVLENETISSLAALAVSASGADGKIVIVPLPNDPRKSFLIVRPDGTYTVGFPSEPPRQAKLFSIAQVGMFAQHALCAWGCRPAIYYSAEGVCVQMEDGALSQKPERAGLLLEPTRVWEKLSEWAEKPSAAFLGHREFMRELRVTFGDSFSPGELESLTASIGQLDFVQGERMQSVQIRNRESMGREVAAEVKASNGTIPEEVILDVRIYRDPALLRRHEIRCLLETDPSNGRLALIPVPGQLDEAIDRELAGIGDMLRAAVRPMLLLAAEGEEPPQIVKMDWQIPVFYGTP